MIAAPPAATRSFRRNRGCGMTSASPSSGAVSRKVWERTPIASPATKAPSINSRDAPRRAIAETISACAATAAARPVMSLSGRSAVNQKIGEHTVMTVAHSARRSAASSRLDEAAGEGRPSNARKSSKSRNISAAPESTLQIASPRGSGYGTPAARSRPVDAFPRAMKMG
jgi:hypothetical protein